MISRLISAVLVTGLSVFSLAAQNTFYFPQVGDGAVANIQFQTSLIFVNVGASTSLEVDFFRTNGTGPMTLTLGSLGTDSSFTIPLAAGESLSVQTPGTGAFQVGYARVTPAAGSDVGGTAVFTRTDIPTGVLLYEAGVPAVEELNDFSLFVDTTGARDTGLALVNVSDDGPSAAGGVEELVRLTLYNTAFQQIATTDLPLRRGVHIARFIPQLFNAVPAAANMEGSVSVSSSDRLVAVTVRGNDIPGVEFPNEVPTLTTFPVIEGTASVAGLGTFSSLSNGSLAITVDLDQEKRPVIGAIFYLYEGRRQVHQVVREVSGPGLVVFTVDGDSLGTAQIDRVEVEFILGDGKRSTRYLLGS